MDGKTGRKPGLLNDAGDYLFRIRSGRDSGYSRMYVLIVANFTNFESADNICHA